MDEFVKYEELSKKIHAPDALKARVLAAAEEMESRPQQKKRPQKVLKLVPKAVAAALLAVMLPLTAYAAVRLFGLKAFLVDSGMENTEAVQELYTGILEETGHRNSYGEYTILEAVCDREVIYLAAKVTPLNESTMLVPDYTMPDDAVFNLGIPGVTEGTVAEYAAAHGKKLAFVSVGYQIGDKNLDGVDSFCYDEDGNLYFYYSAHNLSDNKNITLTCSGVGVDETMRMDRLDRVDFEVKLFDKSSAQENVYYDVDSRVAEETGIQIRSIYIMQTELGLYGKIAFTGDATQWQDHLSLQLVSKSGELKQMPGFTGTGITDNGDGQFTTMIAYQRPSSNDGLGLLIWDYVQEQAYGPYYFTAEAPHS